MSPQRIQRQRTPGWKLPTGAVIVDRTTRYGNPFTLKAAHRLGILDGSEARRVVVENHSRWLLDVPLLAADLAQWTFSADHWHLWMGASHRLWVLNHLAADLAGHDLACPCGSGLPCHADNLLRLANP